MKNFIFILSLIFLLLGVILLSQKNFELSRKVELLTNRRDSLRKEVAYLRGQVELLASTIRIKRITEKYGYKIKEDYEYKLKGFQVKGSICEGLDSHWVPRGNMVVGTLVDTSKQGLLGEKGGQPVFYKD